MQKAKLKLLLQKLLNNKTLPVEKDICQCTLFIAQNKLYTKPWDCHIFMASVVWYCQWGKRTAEYRVQGYICLQQYENQWVFRHLALSLSCFVFNYWGLEPETKFYGCKHFWGDILDCFGREKVRKSCSMVKFGHHPNLCFSSLYQDFFVWWIIGFCLPWPNTLLELSIFSTV